MVSRYARSRQTRTQDFGRDIDFGDEPEIREGLNAEELISAAVAEAKRHVRRNELKTNSALDAISDWIEKSELRRTDETKRLASSQERVASAVRDALGLMTGRLNQIEALVAEAPSRAFEPIRNALGRLDDRVSLMEEQQSKGERNSAQFAAMMESLGQRLTEIVGKIDELADRGERDDVSLREERIAGIEAKLGTILQQLSRPAPAVERMAPEPLLAPEPAYSAGSPAAAGRPRVVLRSVTDSGKLDAAIADIRRKQDELAGTPAVETAASGRAEMSIGLANLRSELGALVIQLQRLEKGRLDPDAWSELLSTTSEVRRLLADPTMPRLAARLEHSLAELTRRVDALTTKVADRTEIAALTAAIGEIRAKLAEPRAGVDPAIVERRIEALSAKIDEVMREPLGLVGQHLADLSARLGSSAQGGASSEMISDICDKLDRIAERSEIPAAAAAPRPMEGEALAEVRDRLDRLSAKLDHSPPGVGSGSIADLRERLDQLAASIEQSASKAPEKIDDVLRQIAANMDAARPADANPAALQSLERQVAELSQRIAGEAGSAVAISDLERSVMRLFDELSATKAAAIKAAEAAASGATQALGSVTAREEREASEREMHSTLDQMNTTLERIMGRLSSLEEQSRPAASARPVSAASAPPPSDAARLAASGMRPVTLAPEPEPMLPDEPADEIDPFEDAEEMRGARAASRGRMPEAPAMPATVSHEPLEPGSGRPPPAAADGNARPQLAGDLSAAVASGGAMSAQALIAAARRAAADTASRQKAAAAPASSLGGAKTALSSLRASASQHKRPILLALIVLMVAFSAIGAGRVLLGNEGAGPEQNAQPANPPAPAGGQARGMSGADASGAATAQERSSSLSAPATQGFTKIGQASSQADQNDLSRPANDVTGSIAAPSTTAAPTSAAPATLAVAAPVPDPANGSEFLARLRLAANADDPVAEYELASRMYDGRGLPRDMQGAAKLFERAANQGLVPAQYRIANIYETGLGATKDLVLARAWFEKAADRGNAKAMHNVGVYLAQGIQGKPDYATAVSWFRKAAERNVRDSQYNLAILLARGLGTDRDFKASYIWFALAARDGDGDSAKKRDEIAAHLSSAELTDAKAVVANWKPLQSERTANEIDLKDIKWDRVQGARQTAPQGASQATQAEAAKTSKL